MKTVLLLTLLRQTTAWCTAEGCQNEYEKPLADYTKYTEGDTYASACYAKFELHHTEPYLYVRGNSHPTTPSRLIICRLGHLRSERDGRPRHLPPI